MAHHSRTNHDWFWFETPQLKHAVRMFGSPVVQVYLHWVVWDRHKHEYLKRIDDFLGRAADHRLKVNLILWDDCGHVEPSLTFADPVRGRCRHERPGFAIQRRRKPLSPRLRRSRTGSDRSD